MTVRAPSPLAAVALLAILAAPCASAQEARLAIRPELRADVITGRQSALQVGGGVQLPAGPYARIGIVAAVGLRLQELPAAGADVPGSRGTDARIDVLGRFLLDPYRQAPYGLSVGAGLSLRAEPDERLRPLLLVAGELEGPAVGGGAWSPAVQVGIGGGARIGVILRRGSRGSR